jgi:hypothetical protein
VNKPQIEYYEYWLKIIPQLRTDDLKDGNVFLEVGDIILYQEKYYGVDSTVSNQYFAGKDPSYPNNENPLNPGLEEFGNNLSVLVYCYYTPSDKVNISQYKERF